MRKNIAIVTGGDSSEYIISIRTANEIQHAIDKKKYNPYIIIIKGTDWYVEDEEAGKVTVDKNNFSIKSKGQEVLFDAVFIAIHGTPGEDGKLQAYFDMLGIPYTSCGFFSSALTFNKYACKLLIQDAGIAVPDSFFLRKKDPVDIFAIEKTMGLPCFIKPNNGGSSFGITKVKKREEILPAIEKALQEDPEVLIEPFIEGTELTCGLVKTSQKDYLFPLTEIVSKNDFFDFEAKYTVGKADEITPARISNELRDKCHTVSSKIYDLLSCKGIVRIDYIASKDKLYFLEINTVPGMSAESIVPKQIKEYGMSFSSLIDILIHDALKH